MDYSKDEPKAEEQLVIEKNKAPMVVSAIYFIVFGIILIVVAFAQADSNTRQQQAMSAACSNLPAQYQHAGGIGCDTSSANSGSPSMLLIGIGIVVIIVSIGLLVATARKPGVYIFDRKNDSFSLDGKLLGRTSDITEVTIRNMRGYPVDINYRDGSSTRLGNYSFKGSATDAASQVASFVGVNVRERGLFG